MKVVVSFSCEDSELRERLNANPVMAQKCLNKSLEPWNDETLEHIARVHLCALPGADSEQISELIATMIKIHTQAQDKAAARRFVAFVKLACRLATQTQSTTLNRIEFLQVPAVDSLELLAESCEIVWVVKAGRGRNQSRCIVFQSDAAAGTARTKAKRS